MPRNSGGSDDGVRVGFGFRAEGLGLGFRHWVWVSGRWDTGSQHVGAYFVYPLNP